MSGQPKPCPPWCTQTHTPGVQPIVHGAQTDFTNLSIVWLQTERGGVVENPRVCVIHSTGTGKRTLEWRPEAAADVGDLLAAIDVQDLAAVAARLSTSFDELGRTL
ncbi:hypothetical protein ACLQ2R_19695 [Streptosporangium sp. DT93]|uniref:hypothetical protein n=1 Tax=Streptosporangium sp. DT93 TaxID=3393428 RepID=UPI003CFB5104